MKRGGGGPDKSSPSKSSPSKSLSSKSSPSSSISTKSTTLNNLNCSGIPNRNHILLIPDNHGKSHIMGWLDAILSSGHNYKWIAIEYVLVGLQDQINTFIKDLPNGEVSDKNLRKFTNVFIYGTSDPKEKIKFKKKYKTGKLYIPTYENAKSLIKVLRKFDKIICLEESPRPNPNEPRWAELLKNEKDSGIVLVGAGHVKYLSKLLTQPKFSIFRNRSIRKHFIRSTMYEVDESKETAMF